MPELSHILFTGVYCLIENVGLIFRLASAAKSLKWGVRQSFGSSNRWEDLKRARPTGERRHG